MAESKAQAAETPHNAGTREPNMQVFQAAQAAQQQPQQARSPVAQPRPEQAPAGAQAQENAVQQDAIRDLDGKFRISLGEGVTREVDASELKDLFVNRHQVEDATRAAQALLQKNASTAAMLEALEKLPDGQREQVMRAIQGIHDQPKPQQRRSRDDDFLADADFDGSDDDKPDPYAQQIASLTRAVRALVEDKSQQVERERRASLLDQVNQEIEQFDQFNPKKVGSTKPRDFLAQAILQDHVANGGKGDVRERTLKWIQDYAQAVPAPSYPQEQANGSQRMTSGFDDFPIPEPATGAQIRGGHALADLLRGRP